MISGVVLRKLQVLDETLHELRSLGTITAEDLTQDWLKLRAIERDLQIAIEVLIDVCQRLISLSGQTPVENVSDAIDRAVQMGALSSKDPYRQMVQFRNLFVHHDDRVDTSVLVSIVNHRLERV